MLLQGTLFLGLAALGLLVLAVFIGLPLLTRFIYNRLRRRPATHPSHTFVWSLLLALACLMLLIVVLGRIRV